MTHYTARQYLITLSRDPAVSYDLYGDTRSSDVPLSVINNLFLCVYIYTRTQTKGLFCVLYHPARNRHDLRDPSACI